MESRPGIRVVMSRSQSFSQIPTKDPVFDTAVARRELKRLMQRAGWSAESLNSFLQSVQEFKVFWHVYKPRSKCLTAPHNSNFGVCLAGGKSSRGRNRVEIRHRIPCAISRRLELCRRSLLARQESRPRGDDALLVDTRQVKSHLKRSVCRPRSSQRRKLNRPKRMRYSTPSRLSEISLIVTKILPCAFAPATLTPRIWQSISPILPGDHLSWGTTTFSTLSTRLVTSKEKSRGTPFKTR